MEKGQKGEVRYVVTLPDREYQDMRSEINGMQHDSGNTVAIQDFILSGLDRAVEEVVRHCDNKTSDELYEHPLPLRNLLGSEEPFISSGRYPQRIVAIELSEDDNRAVTAIAELTKSSPGDVLRVCGVLAVRETRNKAG